MKHQIIIKIVIDVFMTIGLLFAFGYQFWGEKWHEWIGAGMFVLLYCTTFLMWDGIRSCLRGNIHQPVY